MKIDKKEFLNKFGDEVEVEIEVHVNSLEELTNKILNCQLSMMRINIQISQIVCMNFGKILTKAITIIEIRLLFLIFIKYCFIFD